MRSYHTPGGTHISSMLALDHSKHSLAGALMLHRIHHLIDDSMLDVEHDIVLHGTSCKASVVDAVADIKADLREIKGKLPAKGVTEHEYRSFVHFLDHMLADLNKLNGHLRRLLHECYHGASHHGEFIRALEDARAEMDEEFAELSGKIAPAVKAFVPEEFHREYLHKVS